MNILYLETKRDVKGSGGAYITLRNKETLASLSNVHFFSYQLEPYKSLKEIFFYSFFSLSNGMRINTNSLIKKYIKENKIDVVFVDISSIGSISKWIYKNTKVIHFFQNVEYYYMQQEIKNKNRIKRFILNILLSGIYLNEKRICKYAKSIITLNNRDSNKLLESYQRKADFIWSTTFKDLYINNTNAENESDYMLFVGSNFYGNTEGLTWFINNCMPEINFKLKVVGSGMDKLKNHFQNPNVEFYGFAEDLGDLYSKASFVVLPIISGSGMKTKTCEAFMYGKTVFGTTEAFEGYEELSDDFAILCTGKQEFIDKITNYITCKKSKFNQNAREYFLAHYENNVFNKKVNDYIKNL